MKNLIFFGLVFLWCGTNTYSQTTSSPFLANQTTASYLELGFGSTRFHVYWFSYDSAGVYNFNASDQLADIYGISGVEPVIIFKCNPGIPDTSITADTTGWSICEKEFWEKIHNPNLPTETSWYPSDTTAWKNFLEAFVDRYDGDGVNDYSGLVYPFKVYQLETEMPRVWCTNSSNIFPNDYVDYINYSYSIIKNKDPNAIVKMAGWASGSVDLNLFYLNFFTLDSFPILQTNFVTKNILDTSQVFQNSLADFLYIFNNANYDIIDVHCYGMAEHFPARAIGLRTLFDSLGTKPLWALEGGGPFRNKAEVFNPDTTGGYLSSTLLKENAGYVIRYYTAGLGSGFSRLGWTVLPEYDVWGQSFGDLDLLSILLQKKPSYWTYSGFSSLISNYIVVNPITNNNYWVDTNIVGYEIVTPTENLTVLWNLFDSVTINLTGISKQYIYPTSIGDSIWDTLYYNMNNIYSFTVGRIPLIIEGNSLNTGTKYLTESSFNNISIFPNPFSEKAIINVQEVALPLRLTLYNQMGQILRTEQLRTEQYTLRRNNLPCGIYYLSFNNGQFNKIKKVIIY